MKGNVVTIMTNIGSPPQNLSMYAYTPWPNSFSSTDILSCAQYAVGSGGTVEVNYAKGGRPVILVPDDILEGSRLCSAASQGASGTGDSNGDGRRLNVSVASTVFFVILSLLCIRS